MDSRHPIRPSGSGSTPLLYGLTLALAIGTNAFIFSIVNGVVLRPLQFLESGRLAMIHMEQDGFVNRIVSYPIFRASQQRRDLFSDVAVHRTPTEVLTGDGEPEQIRNCQVTGGFHKLLGIIPILGSGLPDSDVDEPPASAVLLSHGLWQRRFGGDSKIMGKRIWVSGHPFTIVGVLPRGAEFPEDADLWSPLSFHASARPPDQTGWDMKHPGMKFLNLIVRIRPELTIDGVRAGLSSLEQQLGDEYPIFRSKPAPPPPPGDSYRSPPGGHSSSEPFRLRLVPLQESVTGDVADALWLLLGAVGFVLLIACANVANLLFARTLNRARELAIRQPSVCPPVLCE